MADLDRLHPAAYRILPAREEDVRWAAALGARVYGGDDVIPEATMVEWFRANPNGFSTFWCGEARVGNFDLLPLRAAPLREFVAGRLLERHVRGADLFSSVRETPAMCAVHFESIVIDPEFAGSRSRMMKMFMLSLPAAAWACVPAAAGGKRVRDCGVGAGHRCAAEAGFCAGGRCGGPHGWTPAVPGDGGGSQGGTGAIQRAHRHGGRAVTRFAHCRAASLCWRHFFGWGLYARSVDRLCCGFVCVHADVCATSCGRPRRGGVPAEAVCAAAPPGVDEERGDLPDEPAAVYAGGYVCGGGEGAATAEGAGHRHRVADADSPDRRGRTARGRWAARTRLRTTTA